MSLLRSKLIAAGVHTLISIVIALVTAGIVYFIWYPGFLAKMLKGANLYFIVLVVEVCLGPLMSLVIYTPQKSRRELIGDYVVVAVVQLSALIYGVYSVSQSRPVYMVFVKDRIEAVAAVELKSDELLQAKSPQFSRLPLLGPKNTCVEMPTDPQEKSDLLLSALKGKDIQLMPKYYRDCHSGEVINAAYAKDQLFSMTDIKSSDLPGSVQSVDFKWLPVSSRFGSGIVIYQHNTTESPVYLPLDPYVKH